MCPKFTPWVGFKISDGSFWGTSALSRHGHLRCHPVLLTMTRSWCPEEDVFEEKLICSKNPLAPLPPPATSQTQNDYLHQKDGMQTCAFGCYAQKTLSRQRWRRCWSCGHGHQSFPSFLRYIFPWMIYRMSEPLASPPPLACHPPMNVLLIWHVAAEVVSEQRNM